MWVDVKNKDGKVLNIPYSLFLSQYKDNGFELLEEIKLEPTEATIKPVNEDIDVIITEPINRPVKPIKKA